MSSTTAPEMVYVARSRQRSGYYHVDESCHRFPTKAREFPLDIVEAWDYDLCKECDVDE